MWGDRSFLFNINIRHMVNTTKTEMCREVNRKRNETCSMVWGKTHCSLAGVAYRSYMGNSRVDVEPSKLSLKRELEFSYHPVKHTHDISLGTRGHSAAVDKAGT